MNSVYEPFITNQCVQGHWNLRVSLPGIYNLHPDFDVADIYLGEPTSVCQGSQHGNYLDFTQAYSDCRTMNQVTPHPLFKVVVLVVIYTIIKFKIRLKMSQTYLWKQNTEKYLRDHSFKMKGVGGGGGVCFVFLGGGGCSLYYMDIIVFSETPLCLKKYYFCRKKNVHAAPRSEHF